MPRLSPVEAIGRMGEIAMKNYQDKGWIGFDLDGTLAEYEPGQGISTIGKPIPKMVERLKRHIKQGYEVKIFTARGGNPQQAEMVKEWLRTNKLPDLEVTDRKDYRMVKVYDDRAVVVEANTGKILS